MSEVPATPTSATGPYSQPHDLSSPFSTGLPTPPDSFRKYSDNIRSYMTSMIEAARKDVQLDRPHPRSSTFDVDYGYDEDPFDVHARMVASMRKNVVPPQRSLGLLFESQAQHQAISARHNKDQPTEHLVNASYDEDDATDDEVTFSQPRPAFLQFRRSSQSVPSLSTGSHTMSRSSTSTSNWSEASFEAIKHDDFVSMYGTASRSSSPMRDLVYGVDRTSISSIASNATVRPARRPSLLRPSSRTRPYESRERLSRECSTEPEMDAFGGRTISEDMIMTAGLMSQRGRNARKSVP